MKQVPPAVAESFHRPARLTGGGGGGGGGGAAGAAAACSSGRLPLAHPASAASASTKAAALVPQTPHDLLARQSIIRGSAKPKNARERSPQPSDAVCAIQVNGRKQSRRRTFVAVISWSE